MNMKPTLTPLTRRQLLQRAALGIGSLALHDIACAVSNPLAARIPGHTVQSLDLRPVPLPWPRLVGKNAKRDIHGRGPTITVAILKTDQGAMGWGELGGNPKDLEKLRALVVGKPVSEIINPAAGTTLREAQPLDIALHDLAGVMLGQPVWKMLGAEKPHLYPVYSGMVYFDDLEPKDNPAGIAQVLRNCAADRELGYRQLKVKIGRGNRWMSKEDGLKRDIEVVREIHKAFPDCELLVDANDGFNVETTIAFLKGIEGIPLFWIEEPFVETVAAWKELHAWTSTHGWGKTLLADGEQHNDIPVLDELEAAGILNVRLHDIIGHGFTPWRALMPKLVKTRTACSPHAFGSGLKTIYAAHLVAGLGNGCSVEGVSCSHEHVDFGENVIRDGKMQVSNKPGFGLALRGA